MLGIAVWYQWLMLTVETALSLGFERNFAISPYLRIFTFSVGLSALTLWHFQRSQYRLRVHRSRVAMFILFMSCAWLAVGMSANAITPYIVTDAYFVLGGLVIALVARSYWIDHLRRGHLGPHECRLPNSLFATIAVLMGTGEWTGISLGPEYALLLLAALGVLVVLQQARFWHIGLALGACTLLAINGNRSFLLAALTAIALISSLGLARNRLAKTSIVLAFAFLAPLGLSVALDFAESRNPDSALGRRLAEVNVAADSIANGGAIEDLPIALYQRIYEIEKVLASLLKDPTNPIVPILGYGFGALIDMSDSMDQAVTNSARLGAQQVHNIHFLPAMIFYRFGLIGVAIFVVFILKIWKIFLFFSNKNLFHRDASLQYVHAYRFGAFIFVVSSLVYSMPAGGTIFDSTFFFIAMGMLLHSEKRGSITSNRGLHSLA